MWMCPNHAETFIDEKLVTSISVVERVKIWNKFSTPIDHEIVKNEFLRKVISDEEPSEEHVQPKSSGIKVPAIIKYHYENPPPLLPSLRSLLRAEEHYDHYSDSENSVPFQLPAFKDNLVRARAVLTPLNILIDNNIWHKNSAINDSIFMRYRSFTIGIGGNSNLDLSQFGKCRNVSAKQATIFYDDMTGLFELINYSEFGSQVDGMLYCLKTINRAPSKVNSFCEEEKAIYNNLQKILDKHRNIERQFYKSGKDFK